MKVALPVIRARREQLALLLQQHRYLPVADLCRRLGISEATARRDLAALEEQKKITRTYGGALVDFNTGFASFRERLSHAMISKKKIALTAARLIRPSSTIFLDSGTTIYALAEQLLQEPVRPLTIVTNNLPIAEILSTVPDVDTHLLGGQFLNRQSVLLGDKAQAALKYWKFNTAFLSAEGVTPEGIWNSQADVVSFQLTVLKHAEAAYFCLDRTKFGKPAPQLLLELKSVPRIITDATQTDLKKNGIRLLTKQWINA